MADATRRKPAGKPTITSHPLFPVIVVLWFGALFGLASLAIRPTLIESFVAATGLDHVIPQAAPPLGTTTRILIALLMTGLGCLAGLLIARRFAGPATQATARRRRASREAEAVSPVALFGGTHDEDEDEDEDEAVEPAPLRRRQLAIMHDEDDFADHAPLPGSKQILSVADLDLDGFEDAQESWLHNKERRQVLSEHVLDDTFAPSNWSDEGGDGDGEGDYELGYAEPSREPIAPSDAFQQVAREMTARDEPASSGNQRSNRLFETYARRVNAGVGSNDSDGMPMPGFVSFPPLDGEDIEPRSMAQDAEPKVQRPNASEHPDMIAPTTATDPVADEPETSPYANTAHRIATAPLDELSHVELLERLGQTIARRRAEFAAAAERAAAEHAAAEHEAVAEAEARKAAAAQIVAAQDTAAAPVENDRYEVPAALRPHWIEPDASDEDEALPAYVPLRHITLKPAPAAMTASIAEDEDVLAQGYSSLLGMTKPAARTEFVHSAAAERESPAPSPVYVFPGLKAAAPAEPAQQETPAAPRAFDAPEGTQTPDATEQALRAALATLQRMSGAA